MSSANPFVVLVAGPNGAGKSTIAKPVLQQLFGLSDVINADTIAQGLSGYEPAGAAFDAGRILLEQIDKHLVRRESFAVETTLAGRSYATQFEQWQKLGYELHLLYIYLKSELLAENRVKSRVVRGGHNIPAATIERRYTRSLHNFVNLYLPLASSWYVVDNSQTSSLRMIASQKNGSSAEVFDVEVWKQILEKAT
jgi:predicted ABC-type ATPase